MIPHVRLRIFFFIWDLSHALGSMMIIFQLMTVYIFDLRYRLVIDNNHESCSLSNCAGQNSPN